jgi:hypothetical protein
MERKITMGRKAFETLMIARPTANTSPRQRFKVRLDLARTTLSIFVLAIAALLSACSTSTPPGTSAPQQIVASSTPSPTVALKPAATLSPTGTPTITSTLQVTSTATALDPCVLIPSQEASSLAGTSFGAGEEGTVSGGGRTCTYGSQSANIFFVEVVQAPDAATADAAQTQFVNDLQANLKQLTSEGLTFAPVPNFADAAITAQANINAGGVTVNGSAFGFRKGTIFFGFSDVVLGGAAPTSDAMQSEATTVLGRLP